MLLLGLDGQVGSLYCPENSYIEMAKYRARNALPQVTFQAASGMDLTRQRWAFLKEKRVKTMLRSAIEQSRHLIINFTKPWKRSKAPFMQDVVPCTESLNHRYP